jgi:peptidoglycan hydrolase-like protein with peptidoglycan-binding domain
MTFPGLIKKGSTNVAAIREIKNRLNELGYKLDPKNINFGPSVEAAVKDFQRKKLLLADGIVGELTWARLFNERKEVVPVERTLAFRAIEIAKSYLYVREKTGKNDGIEVEMFLKSVGLPKGYAWCVAFGYYCFEQAARQLGIANPLKKTAGVLALYNATPASQRFKSPQVGDVGIMDFGGGKGHFFLVTGVVGNKVFTIEGNTSGEPTSAAQDRDGQGVYERCRPITAAKAYLRY